MKINYMTINKKTKKTFLISIITASFLILLPSQVLALSLYLEQSSREVRVGDTVLVNVFLDTEGVDINVLEGKINVLGDILIKDVHTGGSVFSVWQTPPIIFEKEISFVGGTTGSIKGKGNKVFTFAIKPLGTGDIQVEAPSFQGYLSDGKGTVIIINGKPFKVKLISVGESTGQPVDESSLRNKDTAPPNPFTIEVGRENGLVDGKLFLSFISSDDESGIDYYEVKEGDVKAVVSQGVYVLQDQNYSGKVIVIAYDNAGNARTQSITINLGKMSNFWIVYLIGFFLLMFASYLVIRYNKKRT